MLKGRTETKGQRQTDRDTDTCKIVGKKGVSSDIGKDDSDARTCGEWTNEGTNGWN